MAKKVLYLLGAGATHGMMQDYDPALRLMPKDIQSRIFNKYQRNPPGALDEASWDAFQNTTDVEHFISILEYQNKFEAAETIRRLYRDVIVKTAIGLSSSPPRTNLYAVLLDYQLNLAPKHLSQELLGFVSFNYEDILENTISTHFGSVNYVFKKQRVAKATGDKLVSVYKLHGSFNWINSRPIRIRRMQYMGSLPGLWIPPGVDKKKDSYPFNLIWGNLTERLLECDILRIIGCSLSRNDWGLVPIIYTMREFVSRNRFEIEVVGPPSAAETIRSSYGYLNPISSMLEMDDVKDYFANRAGGSMSDDDLKKEMQASLNDPDKGNPFRDWLLSKIYYLDKTRNLTIETDTGIVKDFYSLS
jgi:hypothetical protein